ncbi:hypothetical protein [Kribbella sp. CA-293567]|uniref:hypothetical protein n=1 Tax=Kribbella sp. CA-293567 TaxID=3002436 RepID=UPI0022DE6745|nr:hypothetical protein [Kribbella sp. CA-293567]WBQ05200.1 hypothetical protein OX958_00010 [Kribbella sp. CA-293567]
MTAECKPLAVAYIGAHRLTTDSELPALRRAISNFATARGFTLFMTFVEEPATAPAAFGDMVQNVWSDGVKTVIVPSVVHLAALGNPVVMKTHLEHHIGGKVLLMNAAS